MIENKEQIFRDEITLASAETAPFNFEITIAEPAYNISRAFEITGLNLQTGLAETKSYVLPTREHKSYLDFFASFARDFDARLPQNRRSKFKPLFEAEYRVLLTENLVPGILYGYGDPAVLRVEETNNKESWYYLLSTSNDAPDSFPIIRSQNLENWEFVGFVFPRGEKPAWAADGEFVSDYWAPELHKIGNEFRVYFAARDRNTRELCIGMVKSSRPDGPYFSEKEPILKDNVIDPHIFVADDETAYLYWKKDNNEVWSNRLSELLFKYPHFIPELFPEKEDQITASLISTLFPWSSTLESMERFLAQQPLIEAVIASFSNFHERLSRLQEAQTETDTQNSIRNVLEVARTPIYAQKLSADGLSLVGERIKIIENDLPWEAHLVEGVWVTKQNEKYYLFYAGNDFSTDRYGIGVAISDSPLGPFVKMPEPFLKSTENWAGPGHPSTTIAPDGRPILLFHAFEPGKLGYKEFRALLASSVIFEPTRVLLA